MNRFPQDRLYFHYHYFKNAAEGLSTGIAGDQRITVSRNFRAGTPGTRVAASLAELVRLVKQSGLGVSFSGRFYIEDVTHSADPVARVRVLGWNPETKQSASTALPPRLGVPSQVKVVSIGSQPPPGNRLTANATDAQQAVQEALVGSGFTRASYLAS